MCRIHEKVLQTDKLCYVNALALFDPLNSSITLFYISYTIGTLLLDLFVISDELKIILKKAMNLLKMILSSYIDVNLRSD